MLQETHYTEIKSSTFLTYSLYDHMRNHDVKDLTFKFWDVVVITASDEEQKLAYKWILDKKISNKEIPSGVDYLVFSDPIGPKIGCGGAIMNSLYHLNEKYGVKLKSLFVLIINAGGYSKRMPTSSALGKIFMSLPFGSPVWQVFDLKLACYLPFLQNMNPGFFHAASDTIELFNSSINECQLHKCCHDSFRKKGLTAVAHPSSVEVGVSHGVFVVSDKLQNEQSLIDASATFLECSEVLQKPTLECLKAKMAILKNQEESKMEEYVYTDSCFYFDHDFANKLFQFYDDEKPLTCEIDGYGDFMQCLGPNASLDYVDDYKNVSKVTLSLKSTRTKLFGILNGSRLNVLALNKSEFFHLGTIVEYLDNLNPEGHLGGLVGWKSINSSFVDQQNFKIAKTSIVIESFLAKRTNVMERVVMEYCDISCPIVVNSNCIMSNCYLDESIGDKQLIIPSDCLIHTVAIRDVNDNLKYVTLIFHSKDDLKKVYKSPGDVIYFNHTLSGTPSALLNIEKCKQMFHQNVFSLWNYKLFPCASDMHSSLYASLKLITSDDATCKNANKNENTDAMDDEKYSPCEVMKMKDVISMINFRQNLKDKISKFS